MAAPEDYNAGDVKQDPISGAVAVRTIYPDMEGLEDRQWGVMTTAHGGHYAKFASVSTWTDMTAVEE